MSNANPGKSVRYEQQHTKEDMATEATTNPVSERPRLLACLLLMPSDAEPIVAMLEQLAANSLSHIPLPSFLDQHSRAAAATGECWLEHTEAAKYLGISKSTLYRYASQQRIECRKIAGRLEYRRTSLEGLIKQQTRPARLSHRASGIIQGTLNSGK